ncbi:MAG: peptidase [Bacteroidota bacterium]
MSKNTFILNDETQKNSHGFRVPNAKIDLERFKKNAVLLYMHRRGEVHGKWENIRIEGSLLLADAVFDVDDPKSKEISGKVERGFLNAASIYLNFTSDTTFVEVGKNDFELHGTEALESSVVDIPSCGNALKLFQSGEELQEEQIKGYLLSAQPFKKLKTTEMEKFMFTAVALSVLQGLGVTDTDNPEKVSDAFVKLSADLKTEKEAHTTLKNSFTELKTSTAKNILAVALAEGKITADEETSMLPDTIANPELTAKFLSKIPAKVKLSATVVTKPKKDGDEDAEKAKENWSYAEWQDKDPKGLELMFTQDEERFSKLFNAQ